MPTGLINDIAKRLRSARKAAGYGTAKKFAVNHSIPTSTYSQYEAGKRSLSANLIMLYSRLFQVNPHWLLTGDGHPYSGITIDEDKKDILVQENFFFKADDLSMLKKIFLIAEPLFSIPTKLSYQELIDYCFEIHSIVS